MRTAKGFTLIELVMVMVLLGILAGVLAPLIVQLINAYRLTVTQAELTARGRFALERIVREVRHAIPGTLRTVVDGSGNPGIEFVRARTGGIYVHETDNFGTAFSNLARRFPADVTQARSELYALVNNATFAINAGELLVIGNTNPTTFDAGTSWTGLAVATPAPIMLDDGTTAGVVLTFLNPDTFGASYAGRRFAIADQVVEIGQLGGDLRWSAASTTGVAPGYDGNGDWSVGDPLLVSSVSTTTPVTFSYNPGTATAAGVLQIDLTLEEEGGSVRLYQQVQVRNTP